MLERYEDVLGGAALPMDADGMDADGRFDDAEEDEGPRETGEGQKATRGGYNSCPPTCCVCGAPRCVPPTRLFRMQIRSYGLYDTSLTA